MGDFWQLTAQQYGSLFEKPKMSQKLLEKPPFKYLFDIIIETQKTTGYCKNLYSAEELDPAFYDSKERKLAYLQKIIQVTQLMLNEQILAKPSKIVAGLEPENTNLMLQQIYKAASSGKNSEAAVKKVLAANGADIPPEKAPQQAPPQPQTQKQKPVEQAAPQQQQQPPKQEQKAKPKESLVEPPQPQEIKKKKTEEPPPPQKQPVVPTNQPQQQNQIEARPSTAKRRPPKLTSTQVEEHGAKKVQGPTNVIKDNNDDNFDDMIQTEQTKPIVSQQSKITQSIYEDTNLSQQQHGKFIRGAAQQAEKAAAEEVAQEGEKNDGESKIKLGRLGGKKKADAVKAQVSQNLGTSQVSDTVILQTLVQQICQSANPLGKSLEFISDDLESMNHELTNWRKVYEKSKAKMQEMSKATEETQQPLFDKIAEVEESIREKKNKISNLKAQIIKNKFTIDSLLKSVVVQK